jgi:TolB-like protein/predicted ATPase
MIGTTLAHYRITAALGAGGMGEVWRATDEKLGREVALKVLPEEFVDDPQRLDRFEREARAVAALNHPHIVTIYSVEEAEGTRFLTMELIEGRSLDKLIPDGGLELERFFELATPLAEAISAAHDKSVIHRDLKPTNVMVDGDGRVKVLDFGLAKLQETNEPSDSSEMLTEALTGVGMIVGTVPYMSPEQIEAKTVDHRTDIFSLGVLLYEMAVGERPFKGSSSPALMSSILKDQPPSVVDIRGDWPHHLGRVIGRCVEKDRRDRYQTARDVFNELKALRRESSTASLSRPPVVPSVPAAPRPTSSSSEIRRGDVPWIAVLPFGCPNADQDIEAFADGLEEDIATGLSRFSYLFVVARKSTRRYRGEATDVRQVGEDLGARYVMEGGIRRAESRIRIGMNLIDCETGTHLWSETYDRDLNGAGVFELQDEITGKIVATVADSYGILIHSIEAALQAKTETEYAPWEWLIRLFGYRQRPTPALHARLRDSLEKAVDRDPNVADVWACLSQIYLDEHGFGFNVRSDAPNRALTAAQRAVDIDRASQLGYQVLAQSQFFRHDLDAFRSAADRAMSLNPRDSNSIGILGLLIVLSGEFEHGADIARRAMELNPNHAGWYHFGPIWESFHNRDYEKALEHAKQVNMPGMFGQHLVVAAACGHLGRYAEAEAAVNDLLAYDPDIASSIRQNIENWHFVSGLVEPLMEGLGKAGLKVAPGDDAPDSAVARSGARKAVRIAVLPFVNMSDDRENEFFSDGVTEEILTTLSKIGGLHVISRTSAMAYKGTTQSVREIARELEVGSVLEGSVRRAGNRVRVTAQLIEAATDRHLWSESYDRDLKDIFEVQSDVAVEIARALETELATNVEAQIRQRPTENLEAYDLFLKGRQGMRTLLAPEILRGIGQLEEAIVLDPDFAAAHAELGLAHLRSAYWGAARGRQDFEEARGAAARALELDPSNAVAWVARAGVRCLNDLDWDGSVDDFHEAIRLDPNEVEGHHWLGMTLFLMGRFDDAVAAQEAALSLDPQSPNVASHLGLALCFSGRHEEGERMLLDGIDQHPVFFDFPNFLAIVHKRQNCFAEASRWYDRTCELTGHHPAFEAMHASTLLVAGAKTEALQLLDRLSEKDDDPRADSVARAMIATAERDVGAALRHFHEAVDQRLPLVFWFRAVIHDRELPVDDPGVRALWQRLWPEESSGSAVLERVRHAPLVGREKERATLDRMLDEATSGRGNLPASVDSFVAREAELSEIAGSLRDTPLVTLVGVGGTGKTRLAVESARRLAPKFPDDAWLVELAPVTHAEAVPHVVADLIGAVQQPGKTITQSVVDSLRHRSMLLVLDNCEHVLDAAAELAEAITTRCDGVRILATSRENLAIRGEQVFRLESLSDEHGAVLFRDRAKAAGARGDLDMDTLARLSRRLDGMPLAIELAAARCASMSPEEIEQRFDDRFRLLRGSRRGRLERHQTLRNTVAWSYDLLEPLERQVFDRLSVFAGGFTLEAAEAVAGGDDLDPIDVKDAVTSLVDRSMVLASDTGDGTRFRLLETLRQYGEEQLVAAGDVARTQERHVRFFTEFMSRAWSGLWSAEDPPWIRAIGREYENLRVAVYAAIDAGDREAVAAILKPLIWWAWHALRYEVGDWAKEALNVHPEPAYARAVANHLFTHGGRPEDAVRLVEEFEGEVDAGDPDAECLWAWANFNAGILTQSPEMMEWMHRWVEAGQRTGNVAHTAAIKSIEVVFRVMAGEMDDARRIAEDASKEAESTGNHMARCWATFMKGRAYSDGDHRLALDCFDRAAEIAKQNGLSLNAGFAATEAAVVIARYEEPGRGRERLVSAIRSFINTGDRQQLWTSVHHLAFFLTRVGHVDEARSIWCDLGERRGWAAQHHRDELEELLGSYGESELSDDEFVDHIRGLLDAMDEEIA